MRVSFMNTISNDLTNHFPIPHVPKWLLRKQAVGLAIGSCGGREDGGGSEGSSAEEEEDDSAWSDTHGLLDLGLSGLSGYPGTTFSGHFLWNR